MISPEMHQEMEKMVPADPVGARIMKWVRSPKAEKQKHMAVRNFGVFIDGGFGTVRMFRYPILCWALSQGYGAWWIGCGNARFQIKAPWCEPLFSERYGHARFLKLGGGWRCRFFKVEEHA